jgi:hypothetical protein
VFVSVFSYVDFFRFHLEHVNKLIETVKKTSFFIFFVYIYVLMISNVTLNMSV